mgnify:CR=1 FL=1
MTNKKKLFLSFLAALLLLSGLFVYVKFYFVFGQGVKAGELNYFMHKGYLFKTYEGKLIQTGYRSQAAGRIQSYEFKFSVSDPALADSLMRCSGKNVELGITKIGRASCRERV